MNQVYQAHTNFLVWAFFVQNANDGIGYWRRLLVNGERIRTVLSTMLGHSPLKA